jgi:transcriptional accessory protein Tex/SPT6
MQGLVPNLMRARAYEQLLITAISQEGVCVNSCVQKDWLAPMLQFVPGLGPRKAQALLKV